MRLSGDGVGRGRALVVVGERTAPVAAARPTSRLAGRSAWPSAWPGRPGVAENARGDASGAAGVSPTPSAGPRSVTLRSISACISADAALAAAALAAEARAAS